MGLFRVVANGYIGFDFAKLWASERLAVCFYVTLYRDRVLLTDNIVDCVWSDFRGVSSILFVKLCQEERNIKHEGKEIKNIIRQYVSLYRRVVVGST